MVRSGGGVAPRTDPGLSLCGRAGRTSSPALGEPGRAPSRRGTVRRVRLPCQRPGRARPVAAGHGPRGVPGQPAAPGGRGRGSQAGPVGPDRARRAPAAVHPLGRSPGPRPLPSVVRRAETGMTAEPDDEARARGRGRRPSRRRPAPAADGDRPAPPVAAVAAALHLERHARRRAVRLRLADAVAAAAGLGAAGADRRDHRRDRLRRGCHGRLVRRGADREPAVGRLPPPRLAGAGRGRHAALPRHAVARRGLAARDPRAHGPGRPGGLHVDRHRRPGGAGVRALRRHRPRHPVARPRGSSGCSAGSSRGASPGRSGSSWSRRW